MKYGRIRVGASYPVVSVADCRHNAEATVAEVKRAREAGVKVLVLPELCLTSYTAGDLLFHELVLRDAEAALLTVMTETKDLDILFFVGLPVAHNGRIYNCAAAVCGGRLLGLVPKTFLPNYNEFYEARWFCPAPKENLPIRFAGADVLLGTRQLFACREMPGLVVAAEVCEDIWVPVSPSCAHAAAGATLLVNLSASDEAIGKREYRQKMVALQAAENNAAYIYASCGEGESGTDLVFGGNHMISGGGDLIAERPPFTGDPLIYAEIDVAHILYERQKLNTFVPHTEGYVTVPFSLAVTETPFSKKPDPMPFVPQDPRELDYRCELILRMQAEGLGGRYRRAHATSLVVGISGGLDSTLALLAAARTMDLLGESRDKILAVTMPCFGTTARTRGNAEALCAALGVRLRTIDIRASVEQHFADIGHDTKNYDVVYENAQARERTQILMDLANAEGGLVVGTGDLSELALGFATYNGDHMSMYGVNADIPKTLVRSLVSHCAACAEAAGESATAATLRDIVNTPVSPELLPPKDGKIAQKTEGIVGPYELHDFFLFHFLRYGFPPAKILRYAEEAFAGTYDGRTIAAWLRLFLRRFFSQQFKRSCLPDGPRIGTVALSPRGDWRMPSDATSAAWLSELDAVCRERGWL